MNDNDLRYNAEGYYDPTAYEALTNVEVEGVKSEKDRVYRVRGCLMRVCELAGFKIEGKIVLRDLRTGKVWK